MCNRLPSLSNQLQSVRTNNITSLKISTSFIELIDYQSFVIDYLSQLQKKRDSVAQNNWLPHIVIY